MPMIFPGMDPYLEHPALWPGVCAAFIICIRDDLRPALGTRYVAAVAERVHLEEPPREIVPDVSLPAQRIGEGMRIGDGTAVLDADAPDAVGNEPLEIRESFIELLDLRMGQRVVTVIEMLSPADKRTGLGRDRHLQKRRHTLASQAHLIEIDLLRDGAHALAAPEAASRRKANFDYAVSVHRIRRGVREQLELYPFTLRQRLPRIRVPLAEGDPDVTLDLQAVLEKTYDAGLYRHRLSYDEPPVPALDEKDEGWARERLAGETASNV